MAEVENAHKNILFYTKRDNEVHGPFPHGQVSRYILLGRIKLSDEISEDHQSWEPIANRLDLIPDVLKLDMSIAENREKLAAAKRWADERRVHRSEGGEEGERRSPEHEELLAYRETREKALKHPRPKARGNQFLFLTLLAVIAVAWVAIALTPEPSLVLVDCSSAPAPGVVWSNCVLDGKELQGANLSRAIIQNASLRALQAKGANLEGSELQYSKLDGAELSGAGLQGSNLTGASLREANLQGANLVQANLSYADLTDANLQGALLQGTILDQARWVDGTYCAKGSVGRCN